MGPHTGSGPVHAWSLSGYDKLQSRPRHQLVYRRENHGSRHRRLFLFGLRQGVHGRREVKRDGIDPGDVVDADPRRPLKDVEPGVMADCLRNSVVMASIPGAQFPPPASRSTTRLRRIRTRRHQPPTQWPSTDCCRRSRACVPVPVIVRADAAGALADPLHRVNRLERLDELEVPVAALTLDSQPHGRAVA